MDYQEVVHVFIIDGMVISWTIGTSPNDEGVNAMLDAALETMVDTTAGQSSTLIEGPAIVGLAGHDH